MVLRTAGLPEFVLPFGSITPGTPAAENPALAAHLIAHEAVRVDIDESRLRRLGTYCSPRGQPGRESDLRPRLRVRRGT